MAGEMCCLARKTRDAGFAAYSSDRQTNRSDLAIGSRPERLILNGDLVWLKEIDLNVSSSMKRSPVGGERLAVDEMDHAISLKLNGIEVESRQSCPPAVRTAHSAQRTAR